MKRSHSSWHFENADARHPGKGTQWSLIWGFDNVETHSIQLEFSKGTYTTHRGQTPNLGFCLWVTVQCIHSSWNFENVHAPNPKEDLLFKAIFTCINRTEGKVSVTNVIECLQKISRIVNHVRICHVCILCFHTMLFYQMIFESTFLFIA